MGRLKRQDYIKETLIDYESNNSVDPQYWGYTKSFFVLSSYVIIPYLPIIIYFMIQWSLLYDYYGTLRFIARFDQLSDWHCCSWRFGEIVPDAFRDARLRALRNFRADCTPGCGGTEIQKLQEWQIFNFIESVISVIPEFMYMYTHDCKKWYRN